MTQVRPAAVAGSFYPDEPRALQAAVAMHLARADAGRGAPSRWPKLLVVPHAGYVYSGDVAASAYALLAPLRGRIRRVVLLGPTHRVALRGLAAPQADAFETPLGRLSIDRAALATIADLPQVLASDRAHAMEHSLEVQLPFLQTVLGEGFGLLPLAVGDATPQQVDEVLERLWGGDETLIVISSDLSHYLSYAEARERDRGTVQRILAFSGDLRGDEACGCRPLNGALRTARRHGLVPRLLDLRNSADTAGGDRQRVVGYGAIAFEADAAPAPGDRASDDEADTDPALGIALLSTARAEIADALGLGAPAVQDHRRLHRPGASFVTLHDERGDLRGCVGQLQARRPLGRDVRHNALAAAFSDHRFPALTRAEWAGLHIEVSVLGPLQAMPAAAGFDAAAAQLQPGIDGVVLAALGRQGTFLPQVWAQLPDHHDFLAALLRKAGLPRDYWAADVQLWRYRVTAFEEPRDARTH
ncbi:MAG: AmmeMemoRadiSam system protein B [Burkholderiaceae bacterium]|nr:AmmeMemoRadiSam system protein B [Burkholderiaceae bacterium]